MPSLNDEEIVVLDTYGDNREFAGTCLYYDHGVTDDEVRAQILASIHFTNSDTEHSLRAKCSRAFRRWAGRDR